MISKSFLITNLNGRRYGLITARRRLALGSEIGKALEIRRGRDRVSVDSTEVNHFRVSFLLDEFFVHILFRCFSPRVSGHVSVIILLSSTLYDLWLSTPSLLVLTLIKIAFISFEVHLLQSLCWFLRQQSCWKHYTQPNLSNTKAIIYAYLPCFTYHSDK